MREILFRGKRVDNGEWVEGWYIHTKRHHCIITGRIDDGYVVYGHYASDVAMYVVDPETVGQFTGLIDKKGKQIFEGDIVKDESGVAYPVVYGLTGFFLKYAPPHSHGFHYDLLPLSNYWHAHGAIIEVIGNIHDNPELVEVTDNA